MQAHPILMEVHCDAKVLCTSSFVDRVNCSKARASERARDLNWRLRAKRQFGYIGCIGADSNLNSSFRSSKKNMNNKELICFQLTGIIVCKHVGQKMQTITCHCHCHCHVCVCVCVCVSDYEATDENFFAQPKCTTCAPKMAISPFTNIHSNVSTLVTYTTARTHV